MSGINTNKKIERLDHLIKKDDIALESLGEKIKKLVKQLKGADKIKYPGIYKSNLKKYNELMKQYKKIENSKFEKEKIRHEIYEVVFNLLLHHYTAQWRLQCRRACHQLPTRNISY